MDSKKIKQALATIDSSKIDSEAKNAYYAKKIAAVKATIEKSISHQNVISNAGLVSSAVAVTGMATAYAMGNQSFALLAASGTLGVASSVVTAVAHKYNEIKINSQDKLLSLLQTEQQSNDVSVSLPGSYGNKFKQMINAVKDVIYQHDVVAETIHGVISNAIKNNDHSTIEYVIKSDINAENNPRFMDYLARKSSDNSSFAFSIVETLKNYASSVEQHEEHREDNSIKNAVEAIHRMAESTQTTRWVNIEEFASHYEALNNNGIAPSFHVYPHDDSTVIARIPAYSGKVTALDGEHYNVVDSQHEYFNPIKHPQHIKDVVEHLANNLARDNDIIAKQADGKVLMIELSTTRTAAFMDTGRENELARLLRETSSALKNGSTLIDLDHQQLLDLNGNAVGKIKVLPGMPESNSSASARLGIHVGNGNSELANFIDYAASKIESGEKMFSILDKNHRAVGAMVWASEPDLDFAKPAQNREHDSQAMEM